MQGGRRKQKQKKKKQKRKNKENKENGEGERICSHGFPMCCHSLMAEKKMRGRRILCHGYIYLERISGLYKWFPPIAGEPTNTVR